MTFPWRSVPGNLIRGRFYATCHNGNTSGGLIRTPASLTVQFLINLPFGFP
jgi:hypothetical protein